MYGYCTKRREYYIFFLAVLMVSLSGCGLNSADKPVIPIMSTNTLPFWPKGDTYTEMTAITADRRIVIVSMSPGSGSSSKVLTCSEAPPDVAIGFSSDLQASLSASAATVGNLAEPKVAGAYRNALAVAAMALTQRSQGLQFYRDASFQACQSYMNGIYDIDHYNAAMEANRVDALNLIARQLDKLPELAKLSAPAITSTPTITSAVDKSPEKTSN